MKVLITGASGLVGTACVREFADHDYEVRALDVMALEPALRARAIPIYADAADRLAILRAADGCDAIVHLAMLSNAHNADGSAYRVNVLGAHNVLSAAETLGIRKVVLASTNCVYGMIYGENPVDPQYLPIDENHPLLPQDCYSIAKHATEVTAAGFARRGAIDAVCLRLTGIIEEEIRPFRLRRYRWRLHHGTNPRGQDYWTYMMASDCARAFRQAVERPLPGFNIIGIAALDAFTTRDVRDLVRTHLPAMAGYCDRLQADSPLYDVTRMRELLGINETKSWREFAAFEGVENEPADPPMGRPGRWR